jgi:hypothetical protein
LRKFRLPIFEMRPSFGLFLRRRQPEKGGELAAGRRSRTYPEWAPTSPSGDRAEAGNATDTALCSSNYTTPCA